MGNNSQILDKVVFWSLPDKSAYTDGSKFGITDYVIETTRRLIVGAYWSRGGGRVLAYEWSCPLVLIFSSTLLFLRHAPSQRRVLSIHILCTDRRGLRQKYVPLWGLADNSQLRQSNSKLCITNKDFQFQRFLTCLSIEWMNAWMNHNSW